MYDEGGKGGGAEEDGRMMKGAGEEENAGMKKGGEAEKYAGVKKKEGGGRMQV